MGVILVNQENIAPKKGAAACKHLGGSTDPSVCFGFASPNNYCYRASPPKAVRMSYQDSFCLFANCKNCPVYQSDWSGPLPKEISADPQDSRRGLGYFSALALGVGVILLMLWYASTLIFSEDRPSSPETQSAPEATAPAQESLTATGTILPTQALLIVSTSTQIGTTTSSTTTPTAISTQISTTTTSTTTPTAIPTQTPTVCAPPENWVAYTVQPGDSLQLFRQIYGLRKSKLLAANCNEGLEEVIPGQIFFLPYLPPALIPVIQPPVVAPNRLPRYTPLPEPPSTRP